MASDQLRKKWGTIFMGEREATPQQLDAMQEPLIRERAQHQQQEDYLARVRAKAEERAREILGAAYTERQKVLAEAGDEAKTQIERLTHEARLLKEHAQTALAEAEAERQQAQAQREEADNLRENAHHEGFQAGMEQAGEELKEFRTEVGQMLANVLQALKSQRGVLVSSWRAELAELTRVAVEAGTGWVLHQEHVSILRNLVFESLNLLEDRGTVTLRVHPDDEDAVSDMFRAARERVPELSQWIVNGDPSIEPGGLVAESASGSVENLRQHYREMVDNILVHLTLPPRSAEEQAGAEVSSVVEREAERLAAVAPLPQPPVVQAEPESVPAESESVSESVLVSDAVPESALDSDAQLQPPVAEQPETAHEEQAAVSPASGGAEVVAPHEAALPDTDFLTPPESSGELAMTPRSAPVPEVPVPAEAAEQAASVEPPLVAPQASAMEGAAHLEQAVHDAASSGAMPLPADAAQHAAGQSSQPQNQDGMTDDQPLSALEKADWPAPDEMKHDAPHAANDNPSLAELEDELFPLPEEENGLEHEKNTDNVFASGGFLPGSGKEA